MKPAILSDNSYRDLPLLFSYLCSTSYIFFERLIPCSLLGYANKTLFLSLEMSFTSDVRFSGIEYISNILFPCSFVWVCIECWIHLILGCNIGKFVMAAYFDSQIQAYDYPYLRRIRRIIDVYGHAEIQTCTTDRHRVSVARISFSEFWRFVCVFHQFIFSICSKRNGMKK